MKWVEYITLICKLLRPDLPTLREEYPPTAHPLAELGGEKIRFLVVSLCQGWIT